jgi:DNA-binding response OmpR family regulator
MTARILVIEDDPEIALAIRTVLQRGGYEIVEANDGKQGLRTFHAKRPDCVILDVGLPVLDGWNVLERLRDVSDVPVLLLTAHGLESEKVRGLSAGADDYLTKPFGNGELLARVQALLRRSAQVDTLDEVYDDGRLQIQFASHQVSVGGESVQLTPTEFRLLAALVKHSGQILSSSQLVEQAWNDPLQVGPERVKFSVMRLRRKLGQLDGAGLPIEAVRGFGYRYVVPLGLAGRRRAEPAGPYCYRPATEDEHRRYSCAAIWRHEHKHYDSTAGTDPRCRGRSRCGSIHRPRPAQAGRLRGQPHSRPERRARPGQLGELGPGHHRRGAAGHDRP